MTKDNKATKVRNFLESNPFWRNKTLAKHLGVSESYVWIIRRQMAHNIGAVTPAPTEAPVEAPVEVPVAPADSVLDSVDAVLTKRASTYGNFVDVARITQRLKHVAHTAAGERGRTFASDQAEAMDMIFSKLARIINGDANHIDSWLDIAGYAKLVADRLEALARGLPKQE